MAASCFDLPGCDALNRATADRIAEKLGEKYGEAFLVTALGNRLNREMVRAFCVAQADPTLAFTACLSPDGGAFLDEYAVRRVGRQAERLINGVFAGSGVLSQCHAEISGIGRQALPGDPMGLPEFVRRFRPDCFTADLVLPASSQQRSGNEEFLKAAFAAIYAAIGQVKLAAKVRWVEDGGFAACAEMVKSAPALHEAWFRKYAVTKAAFVSIDAAGCSVLAGREAQR
jgi:hypothetical protein